MSLSLEEDASVLTHPSESEVVNGNMDSDGNCAGCDNTCNCGGGNTDFATIR